MSNGLQVYITQQGTKTLEGHVAGIQDKDSMKETIPIVEKCKSTECAPRLFFWSLLVVIFFRTVRLFVFFVSRIRLVSLSHNAAVLPV